ncbi:hypothetical protein KLEB273_gp112 [Bacillus phage vB_BauM_KLEB27-3]|nr:hypothetical protein KLEB273_gp112 [Bacillus phage vB_BauM_KLEB27-3]
MSEETNKDYENIIDRLFNPKSESLDEKSQDKFPTKRLKIPELPPQTKQQHSKAMKYADQELGLIDDSLNNFIDQISDTVLFNYLEPHLTDFIDVFEDLKSLTKNDINENELTDKGASFYERVRSIHRKICEELLKQYEGDEPKNGE